MKEPYEEIYQEYLIYKWLKLQGKFTALEAQMERHNINIDGLYDKYGIDEEGEDN